MDHNPSLENAPLQQEDRAVCCQYIDMSFPVELSPNLQIGAVHAESTGKPLIECHACNGSCCEFVVTQKVRLRFTVQYGIHASVGGGEITRLDESQMDGFRPGAKGTKVL